MKKFTSLMLMLLCTVTAWAQTELPELTVDTNAPVYYSIQDRDGYFASFTHDQENLALVPDLNPAAIFYFTGSIEGEVATVKIHNKATNLCMNGIKSWTAEGSDWYIQAPGGSNTALAISTDAAAGTAWNDSYGWNARIATFGGTDGGSTFVLTKLTNEQIEAAEYKEIKHNELISGNAYTFLYLRGDTYLTHSTNEGETDALKLAQARRDIAANDDNKNFVYYVSPVTNSAYLYNLGAGKFVGTGVSLVETPNTTITIKATNIPNYPVMLSSDGTNTIHNGSTNGNMMSWGVGSWYPSDAGNATQVRNGKTVDAETLATIAELVDAYETPAKKAELQTLINAAEAYTFGTMVGQYTQAAIEETLADAILVAEEAYNNATTATQAIEAINTLQNVIDNLAIVLPSADKFYKIVKYDDATKVVYIENGLKGNWGENTTPASVWAFEQGATDGKFYLRNVGTGSYINGYAKDYTIYGGDKKDETSVILYDASKRQVGIAPNDGEHFNRASGRLCAWTDHYANSNSAWLIEEVNEFAHTLTVGDAGYTTLVLGFNATVPAIEGKGNGVFTATVDGEWIDLTPVAAGSVLPANTAVIIKAAAKTVLSFAYSAEPAAEVTTDLLGTLYDKNVAPGAGNTAYVLSMQNEVVGFYRATLNQADNKAFKNNANKAYLVVENASPASLSFRFPGTTGIEEITDNREQSTVIYDLTGRRVEAITAPGIYIVNGKKTLVK